MGELYKKLADQIYSIEDSMDTQPKEHLNKVVEVNVDPEPEKSKFTEKEQLMMNMANISGQIKKLKRDIDFEVHQPAIDKLNTKIDELKEEKKELNNKIAVLKNKMA